jgi:hypothetical protein
VLRAVGWFPTRLECGLGACDGFESTDGDVRCAGLRERSKGRKRNLGVGVGGGCLRKTIGSGDGEERCENDLCKSHQKLVAESTGIWKSRAQLMALDC